MHVYAAARNAKLPMGNILGPDQMVVKDPNDQTFDHQTFDDPGRGRGMDWGYLGEFCGYLGDTLDTTVSMD